MTCEQLTSAMGSAEAYGLAQSSDGSPSMRLTMMSGDATASVNSRPLDGGQGSPSNAPTSLTGSRPAWMEAWISSQRASLAAISAPPGCGLDLAGQAPGQPTGESCGQSTLGDLVGSSWRTALASAPMAALPLPAIWWRADTAGETESLPRLMSEPHTSGTGGTALPGALTLLPTLTICGNCNAKGASENSGDGLVTALRKLPTLTASDGKGGPGHQGRQGGFNLRTTMTLLPTLCATDCKSPYSKAGYERQTEKRSKPLRDTAAHTIGIRLTEAFCAWWMGWPMEFVAATRALSSPHSETHGARCRQPLHGAALEGLES